MLFLTKIIFGIIWVRLSYLSFLPFFFGASGYGMSQLADPNCAQGFKKTSGRHPIPGGQDVVDKRMVKDAVFGKEAIDRLRPGDKVALTSIRGNRRDLIVLYLHGSGLQVKNMADGNLISYKLEELKEGKMIEPSIGKLSYAEVSGLPSSPQQNRSFESGVTFLIDNQSARYIRPGSKVTFTSASGREYIGEFSGFNEKNGEIDFFGKEPTFGAEGRLLLKSKRLLVGQVHSVPALDPSPKGLSPNEKKEIIDRGDFADWFRHVEHLEAAMSQEAAFYRGEKLKKELNKILIDLRIKMKEIDFSKSKNNRMIDLFLQETFQRLHDRKLLEGTGYTAKARNHDLTVGKMDLENWVTGKDLERASKMLARKARIEPGTVILPDYHQLIDGRFVEHNFSFSPNRDQEDKNDRRFYVEQILVTLEQYGHVAQSLLKYSNTSQASQSNLSRHGRENDITLNSKKDIVLWLQEGVGSLLPVWYSDRNSKRENLPRDLPVITEP